MQLDEYGFGLTWVLDEPLRRASHALADAGRVWLIDAVDAPGALDRALALGDVAAVLQLLDRHGRDSAAIAERLGVPLLRIPDAVPDSPFEVLPVVGVPGWREVALWWPERRALVVAEAVGTGPFHVLGLGAVGVHPLLRLRPPRALPGMRPEHLLVGHGAPVHGPAAEAELARAYQRSRLDPRRLLGRVRGLGRR